MLLRFHAPNLCFQNPAGNDVIVPEVSEVCFIYCAGDNCTSSDCRPVSGNNNTPFRINNTVNGTTYTVNISLGNDFGQSGQTTALYGECIKQFLLRKYCVYSVDTAIMLNFTLQVMKCLI